MQQDAALSAANETQDREDSDVQETIQLCIFNLADRLFCLRIGDVREILEDAEIITPVPTTPSFLRGVINLRGDIVPIVDIRNILQLPVKERTRESRIMILNIKNSRIGILVDAITEVRHIEKRIVQTDIAQAGIADGKFISNIIEYNDNLLVLLNLESLYAAVQL